MYKLVTFDINGTLLKLKYPVGLTYSSVAKNYGVILNSDKVNEGFKYSWKTMCKQHPNFGRESMGWKNWWKNIVIESIMKSTGNDCFKNNDLDMVAEKLIEVYGSDEGWALAPGSLDILQYLKRKKIKLGIISNNDPRLHGVLESLKLQHYFDFILTSYEVGFMKPDIKIFKIAEEISNIEVECDKLLHVGDSVEQDYLGALHAGWDSAVLSANKDKLISYQPILNHKRIFSDLFELMEFIKRT